MQGEGAGGRGGGRQEGGLGTGAEDRPAKVELLYQLIHLLLGTVQIPLPLHHLILGLGHRSALTH